MADALFAMKAGAFAHQFVADARGEAVRAAGYPRDLEHGGENFGPGFPRTAEIEKEGGRWERLPGGECEAVNLHDASRADEAGAGRAKGRAAEGGSEAPGDGSEVAGRLEEGDGPGIEDRRNLFAVSFRDEDIAGSGDFVKHRFERSRFTVVGMDVQLRDGRRLGAEEGEAEGGSDAPDGTG